LEVEDWEAGGDGRVWIEVGGEERGREMEDQTECLELGERGSMLSNADDALLSLL